MVFFEEWCPFSQNAMPRAEKTYQQYRGQGLDVIGFTDVDRSSTDDDMRQFLADKDITFTAVKENGRLWNFFNCRRHAVISSSPRGLLGLGKPNGPL